MVGPDLEELRANLTHIEHGQTLRFETASVGEPLLILSSGLKVKRFPNCGSAHRAMDGLLALIEEHGFTAGDIADVHVSAPASHLANLMYEEPANPAQAKFSLEYALAMIALHRRCSLADFEEPAVHDPEARAFFGKVRRIPVDKSEGEFPTQVEVTLTNGATHRTAVEMPVGSLAAPLAERQYGAKFDECAERFIPSGELAELKGELGKLADLESIAPVMDRLARVRSHDD
jgi:2-methylcitrate dehydratase PrpD